MCDIEDCSSEQCTKYLGTHVCVTVCIQLPVHLKVLLQLDFGQIIVLLLFKKLW